VTCINSQRGTLRLIFLYLAPLGKLDYMIEGAMIGGFALVAVPADYRVTGVKTLMVSYDRVVFQKDLGSDSLNVVKSMELYIPDRSRDGF
jgi:hypothetical protein